MSAGFQLQDIVRQGLRILYPDPVRQGFQHDLDDRRRHREIDAGWDLSRMRAQQGLDPPRG